MAEARKRVLFYLLLAVACYALAAYLGEGQASFVVFFAVGGVAELVFWSHLILRVRQWFSARPL